MRIEEKALLFVRKQIESANRAVEKTDAQRNNFIKAQRMSRAKIYRYLEGLVIKDLEGGTDAKG